MKNEIWKPALGWEGIYEVSNQGRAKSLHWTPPRIMKPGPARGYMKLIFHRIVNGVPTKKHINVHRLMLETFTGPHPGMDAAHINGKRDDNRLENLKWCTRQENLVADRKKHGRFPHGETSKKSKLKDRDVLEIRASAESNETLGKRFGIHPGYVAQLRKGKGWDHLKSYRTEDK